MTGVVPRLGPLRVYCIPSHYISDYLTPLLLKALLIIYIELTIQRNQP